MIINQYVIQHTDAIDHKPMEINIQDKKAIDYRIKYQVNKYSDDDSFEEDLKKVSSRQGGGVTRKDTDGSSETDTNDSARQKIYTKTEKSPHLECTTVIPELQNNLYVDWNDFDIDRVVFEKINYKTKHRRKFLPIRYTATYLYGFGDNSLSIKAPLRIMCDSMKLNTPPVYKFKHILPCENESILRVKHVFYQIRRKFCTMIGEKGGMDGNYLNQYMEKDDLQILLTKTDDQQLPCKIIRLGSRSENNVNRLIETLDQFNSLFKDWRYNRKDKESYYIADVIVRFTFSVVPIGGYYRLFNKENNNGRYYVSFKSVVDIMEMRYNKASCIPVINHKEQYLRKDNVLVL